jgi:CheY-like chemotaxis protein
MSHELRTPLNGILGLSEALQLQTYGDLGEKQLRAIKNIESSGQHLLGLINDILDLSKIGAGKLEIFLEPTSIVEVCQESLSMVKELSAQKGIVVNFAYDPLITLVLADQRRLKQILVNLLNNAVKFTPAGGKVTLNVSADDSQRMVDFTVIDTGIGIAPENLPRLFVPFTQIDSSLTRQHEGTGLGLALVKELAELHNGSVRVTSEVGVGSTFTVSVPWLPEATPRDASHFSENLDAGFAPAQETNKRLETLLLAEDAEINIMSIGDYLESIGYHMVYAMNGREAIDQARKYSPDLILMDVQMPVMDGLEATRRLRADPRFAHVPIIALTAMAMPGDRDRCLEAGTTDYVSKPISVKELAELIRKLLTR